MIINKLILMGRLTKDPETRYTTTNNTAVCNFTLAVDRRFNKPGETRQADFINCIAWSKLAELIAKYFAKGSKISIVGRIQTRTWDDTEGKKHYVTEIVVEEAYFCESRNTGGATGQNEASGVGIEDNEDELPF